jgi:hypothetical protein
MKTTLFLLLLCATAATYAEGADHITERFTDIKAWHRCVNKAVAELEAQGKDPGTDFGAGGGGLQGPELAACGYAPAPKQIPAKDMEYLESCRLSPDPDEIGYAFHFWDMNSPKYKAKVIKECKRIYNSPEGIAARAADKKEREREKEERYATAIKKSAIVIRIGSHESDVYEKYGPQVHVIETVTKYGVHKQFVIDNKTIYTDNGVVTTLQQSR